MSEFRSRAPLPTEPRAFSFPSVRRESLRNGLRVLVSEKPGSGLVSVRLVVEGGGDRDARGESGLASLTAGMLDEGAGDRSAIAIAEEIANLGGSLGSSADWDASYVWLDVLGRCLEPGLSIAADCGLRPLFDESELERVRDDRLTTILQQRDDAASVAAKAFSKFVFNGTPYEEPMIGNASTLPTFGRDDLRHFFRRYYGPRNASLIIVGDLPEDGMIDLADRCFASWQADEDPVEPKIEAPQASESRIHLIDRPGSVQSEIRVGHNGVSRDAEDYVPIVVMNSLLGEIFNSRIMLNLREQNGYTYAARSSFVCRKRGGAFVVSTAVRNEVTAESIAEILGELERIGSGDITDEELANTQSYLMGVFPATVQTVHDLAGRIQEIDLYGLPNDYFDHWRDRIAAVTADDVVRVAREYVHPDRSTIVVVGNRTEIEEQLGKLGLPISLYDLDGEPLSDG